MDVPLCVASLNVLNPIYAIKYRTAEGLSSEAQDLSQEKLRESLADGTYANNHNWFERLPLIKEAVKQADIICLQEVCEPQNFIPPTGYKMVAFASEYDDRVPVMNTGSVILCRTHYRVVDVHSLDRNCSVELDIDGFGLVRVVSLHLHGYYRDEMVPEKKRASQRRGYDELTAYRSFIEYPSQERAYCVVIAGDFNEDERELGSALCRMDHLRSHGYRCDESREVSEPGTGTKIDWIFVKGEGLVLRPITFRKETLSDHLMIGTSLSHHQ